MAQLAPQDRLADLTTPFTPRTWHNKQTVGNPGQHITPYTMPYTR
jgi:hypothetical protein